MKSKICLAWMFVAACAPNLAQAQSSNTPKTEQLPGSCMPGMVMPGCAPTGKQERILIPFPKTASSTNAPSAGLSESNLFPMANDLPAPEILGPITKRAAMSLENFLQSGDTTNPTLQQAEGLVQRSRQQAKQAGLYPNPSVGYEGDQIRGGSFGGGEQGGFVQQTIVLGGKLGLRREIYRQQQASDEIGKSEQFYRVHNDIERAFYDALAAQALVRLRQGLLGVALDAVETVHQLANVGQADEPDILQMEVEAEQARVDYVDAQRDYLQQFRVLSAFAGMPDLPACPLQGDLEQFPQWNAQQIIEQVMQGSPTLQRAKQEVAVAAARLKDAQREFSPDLQLRAGEQYNGERTGGNSARPAGAQSFASAGIDLPLWNRNQGNIGAAKVDLERAHQNAQREQLSLGQRAASFAQRYESAQFEAERYKADLLPRAGKSYRLNLEKYEQMAQAYPQVLISQRTYFQLQIRYLMALRDVWHDAVALQNFTLTGGLEAPGPSGQKTESVHLAGPSEQ